MIHNLIFIAVQQSRYFISKICSLFRSFTHHVLSSPQTSSTSFSIIIHKHWTFLCVPEKIVRINGEYLKTPTTTSAHPSESVHRYFPLQPVTMDYLHLLLLRLHPSHKHKYMALVIHASVISSIIRNLSPVFFFFNFILFLNFT